MAKNKTTETSGSVTDFINTVVDEVKRADSFRLVELVQAATGLKAKMWGAAIVGFGNYHYKYDSGHEGDAPVLAFSPRKAAISLYLAPGFPTKQQLLQQLGKHKGGVGCVYVKKLADVNEAILKQMFIDSVAYMNTLYKS